MQIEEIVLRYSNMLYKICIVMLCNEQDAKDAIQDTFCKYLEKRADFANDEHEKAWLIRVATNICRDMLRSRIRHPKVSIECKGNCGYSGNYAKCSKEKTAARQRISAAIVEGGL